MSIAKSNDYEELFYEAFFFISSIRNQLNFIPK
jgi:hypothetical protein